MIVLFPGQLPLPRCIGLGVKHWRSEGGVRGARFDLLTPPCRMGSRAKGKGTRGVVTVVYQCSTGKGNADTRFGGWRISAGVLETPKPGPQIVHECSSFITSLGFKPRIPFAPQRGHDAKQSSPSVVGMFLFEAFDGREVTFPSLCR